MPSLTREIQNMSAPITPPIFCLPFFIFGLKRFWRRCGIHKPSCEEATWGWDVPFIRFQEDARCGEAPGSMLFK